MTRRLFGIRLLHPATCLAQTPTFRSEVNLVSVRVRVTDRKGRPIGGLPPSRFELLEDDVPQRIAVFDAGEQPLSWGILLDTSSSMREGGKLDRAKAALAGAIASGHRESEVFFIEFSSRLEAIIESGGQDRRPILHEIAKANAGRTGTALYDAIAAGLCLLRRARHPRQALLVVTDGADQHSRLALEAVIAEIQRALAQVYLVGCFSREENEIYNSRVKSVVLVSGRQIDNPRVAFARLAEESGAEAYFPQSAAQLEQTMESIQRDLRTAYTLGYYPLNGPQRNRRIVVKVGGSDYRVRARRGVSTAQSTIDFDLEGCTIAPESHRYPYERRLASANGRLLYREDFSDPGTGWPVRDCSWYGSGEYHLALAGTGLEHGDVTVSAYGPWWQDVRAAVSVRSTSDGVQAGGFLALPGAGLITRLNERGFYVLLTSGSGGQVHAKLSAVEFHPRRSVDLLPWTAYTPRPGPWHRLAMECHGDEIHGQADGIEICRVRDRRFGDGYVGMALSGVGHAVFKDLLAED